RLAPEVVEPQKNDYNYNNNNNCDNNDEYDNYDIVYENNHTNNRNQKVPLRVTTTANNNESCLRNYHA
ncbi:13591_t:CDS:2, partial [Entrophospora sp. SA101]